MFAAGFGDDSDDDAQKGSGKLDAKLEQLLDRFEATRVKMETMLERGVGEKEGEDEGEGEGEDVEESGPTMRMPEQRSQEVYSYVAGADHVEAAPVPSGPPLQASASSAAAASSSNVTRTKTATASTNATRTKTEIKPQNDFDGDDFDDGPEELPDEPPPTQQLGYPSPRPLDRVGAHNSAVPVHRHPAIPGTSPLGSPADLAKHQQPIDLTQPPTKPPDVHDETPVWDRALLASLGKTGLAHLEEREEESSRRRREELFRREQEAAHQAADDLLGVAYRRE